ncbi:1,4-alpha-glucan branching protein GlgB [uncultured Clostridium sp.]|uniref:1,4-alpha-glucan branching protein GlgB n=1 Tax=uncultured Clostridium sp. TaxID=59620 RepID=UPI0025DC68FA|nr:1,4-alpha-glucan branching protein GlgB [uncultured Clostridium sp.]
MSDKPNASTETVTKTEVAATKVDYSASSTKEKSKTTRRKSTSKTSKAKSKAESKEVKVNVATERNTAKKASNSEDSKNVNIDTTEKSADKSQTEIEVKADSALDGGKTEKKTTRKTTTKARSTKKTTKTTKTSKTTKAIKAEDENKEIKAEEIKETLEVKESVAGKNEEKAIKAANKVTDNKEASSDKKEKVNNDKIIDNKSEAIESKKALAADDDKQGINSNADKTEITSFNEYLFHKGKNYNAYDILGAHIVTRNNEKGVQFATWAPRAKDVYIVGDFNDFTVREEYKLKKISDNGIWVGFFKQPKEGDKYKYCIVDNQGKQGEYKSDPYAVFSEVRPNNASIIYSPKDFKWNDKKWIDKRNKVNVLEQPLNIYEIHLGSWKTNKDGEFLTYQEISELLPKYLREMGYSHVEIMPLVEHPLDASWGYQGTGYYSPTSRYGNPEGLKVLINKLHEENIGVIMDWVPGHFCKDAHGLYKFDGTATYEYQEEWRANNKGWGTCNFDLGRPEVQSYLISNALYWFREFHIDGLRVDAVSSILYLDYSREPGEWQPNKYGGNGNLEAIDFLKQLNQAVFAEYPTALMIAEESTAWPNITKPPMKDGLGFNMKWNMGWMNDTLEYIKIDPKYRKHNHRNITFAMMYNYAENYLLPLSHDEVVHGKCSLIEKMWGDEWNKYAGLRAFMGYMMGHPGKKLTFMGCEFAQGIEWREYEELEWRLIEALEMNKKTHLFFKDLNNLYLDNKAFWELDHDYRGFNWIEADNSEQSILIFARRSRKDEDTLIFVVNFKPTVYYDYQIGVPFNGEYEELFNTDDVKYGGSGQVMGTPLFAEKAPFQNQPYSLKIKVPPMATLVLKVKNIIANEDKETLSEDKKKEIEK